MRFHLLRIFGDLNVPAAALNLALHDAAVAADRRSERGAQRDRSRYGADETTNALLTAQRSP